MKSKIILLFIGIILLLNIFSVCAFADGELFTDTFDNMADGYIPTNADGWSMDRFNSEPQDSVSVQSDPLISNNKALRFFKSDKLTNTVIRFSRNIVGAEFGRIEISYKLRFEQLVQELSYAGTVRGYKYDANMIRANNVPITVYASKLATGSSMIFSWLDSASYNRLYPVTDLQNHTDKWYTVKMVVDTNRDTYDLYLDGVLVKEDLKFSIYNVVNTDTDGIFQMDFGIKMTAINAGPSIIWVDDVSVRKVPQPTVVLSSPVNGGTDVSITPTVNVDFNVPMKSSLVNKTNVKVFKGTSEVASSDYNVNLTTIDGLAKRISVSFNNSLDYKTDYSVKVLKAIESEERNPLQADYTVSFKTKAPAFDVHSLKAVDFSNANISSLYNMKNQPVTISVALKNNEIPISQMYAVTLAITNKDGDMVRKKSFVGILNNGASTILTWPVIVPSDVDNLSKVDCYIWSSFTGMKKLYSQITLP